MLLRGFRLFGVALHREPKGTKRPTPGMGNVEGGSTIRALLTEFLRFFFPSNAFMAFARSFYMFNCMSQNKIN